jgi:transcriptional regulator with XRE-family HTH domain
MGLTDEVGKALRFLRKRRGMTQKSVAGGAGISKNLLSNWETGATAPSLGSLEKVMGVLDVDLLELYNTMNLMTGRPFRETRPEALPIGGTHPPDPRSGYSPWERSAKPKSSEVMDSLLLFVGLLRMMSQATRDASVLEEMEQLLQDRIHSEE